MANNKTIETSQSVEKFINAISEETKRENSRQVVKMMQNLSGFEPKMWGSAIIGFGTYHYKYTSGREGDMPLVCFSPRKAALVFYISLQPAQRDELLPKLGKHKTEKGCISIKQLADIDLAILKKIISASVSNNKSEHPAQ